MLPTSLRQEALVNQINKDFGHIDILVNNAGITKDGLMLKMTEQQWDAVINVNLKSALQLHPCNHPYHDA